MFSAGIMSKHFMFQMKFPVTCTARMSHNIWKRIGNFGHSLRPQVRRENRVRAHNWSKFFPKKHYFFHALIVSRDISSILSKHQ